MLKFDNKWLALTGVLASMATHAAEVECRVSALNRECGEAMEQPHTPEVRKGWKLQGVPLERKLSVPGFTEQHCEADIDVSYMQMNDRIRVDTSIDTDKCGPAGGEYELQIRTYDLGKSVTRAITQSWQRQNSEPFESTQYFPMEGANKLGWVRVKSDITLACLCLDTSSQDE